ncbi:hypothetical protein SUDANB121_03548 [Nocardiopsis dassonvillei]|uniref:CsbD family protein n=1 Tax=Nocardiopsis dassonvillei TaxID=2014 RepID=UPI003F573A50
MSETNKAKAKAYETKGTAKEGLGKATGNRRMETEGKAEKKAGKAAQAGEKAREAVTPDRKRL